MTGIRHRGITVLLVTHHMDEVERLCDRVAVIDDGRVVALATYRERGILRRLSTTPAKPAALPLAYLSVHLVLALAALALTLVVGMLAVDMRPSQHVVGWVLSRCSSRRCPSPAGTGPRRRCPPRFSGAVRSEGAGWLSRIGDFAPLGAFRITVQESWAGRSPEWIPVMFVAACAGMAFRAAARVFRWE